jgi:hypothetical protein
MTGAVLGFFGSIVALVAAIVATAAGITFFVVLWKSGALPEVVGLATALISGAFAAVGEFFGFLRELVTFAGS